MGIRKGFIPLSRVSCIAMNRAYNVLDMMVRKLSDDITGSIALSEMSVEYTHLLTAFLNDCSSLLCFTTYTPHDIRCKVEELKQCD